MRSADEPGSHSGSPPTSKSDPDPADEHDVQGIDAPPASGPLLDALWSERGALERVVLDLGSVASVLDTGDERLLPVATTSLREGIERAGEAEAGRLAAADRFFADEGNSEQPASLRTLLEEHESAAHELRTEIRRRARDRRDHVEIQLHLLRRRAAVLESQQGSSEDALQEIEREEEVLELRLQELTYRALLELLRRLARPSS